jgi:hypothetical protein
MRGIKSCFSVDSPYIGRTTRAFVDVGAGRLRRRGIVRQHGCRQEMRSWHSEHQIFLTMLISRLYTVPSTCHNVAHNAYQSLLLFRKKKKLLLQLQTPKLPLQLLERGQKLRSNLCLRSHSRKLQN